MPRSRQLSALLTVFCLVLAACTDDEGAEPQPTTTTVTTTTTSPEASDEQALRQLAEDWYLVVRQVTYGELEFEAARDYISGAYLEALEEDVREFQASGNQGERDDRTRSVVESVSIEGDEADLVECLVDFDVLLSESGEVVNDDVISTRFTTHANRTDVGWRFVEREQVGESSEGESCSAR